MDSELAEQANRALVAFLRAELQLGLTYLRTAKVDASFDSEGERCAVKLGKGALDTIERFRHRITDPALQEELQKAWLNLRSFFRRYRPNSFNEFIRSASDRPARPIGVKISGWWLVRHAATLSRVPHGKR